MKILSLLAAILLQATLLLAQSPSPTAHPHSTAILGPTIVGYLAGLKSSGTDIWMRPMSHSPGALHGRAIYISGTAAPTLAAVQLALAQNSADVALARSYASALAAGITVTSGSLSITLPAEPADQAKFNGLLSLFNTAPMPPTFAITDIRGNPWTVTVGQFYTLIGSYGQQIAGLWNALTTAKSSVAAATGTAALSSITLADPTGQ